MSKTLHLVRRIACCSTPFPFHFPFPFPFPFHFPFPFPFQFPFPFNTWRHAAAVVSPPHLSLFSSLFARLQFSSHSSPPQSSTESSVDAPSNHNDLPKDVSTQELKERIDKYLHGDMDAIPSIFEAILTRKLSGNHENSDDEIMEEFMSKTPHDDVVVDDDDDDFDLESDESLSESDEEFSD